MKKDDKYTCKYTFKKCRRVSSYMLVEVVLRKETEGLSTKETLAIIPLL